MKKSIRWIALILFLSLWVSGCNYRGEETTLSQVDQLNTAAAATIQAQQTLISQATVEPTQNETSTPTPDVDDRNPGDTDENPAATPLPEDTPTPSTKCDQAAFVTETVLDGTKFKPGETFTKTWTLKNNGNCIWDSNYDVIFFEGDAMGGPASQPLTSENIAPGETVQISMEMRSPITTGTHRGDFKLRNASGIIFGIGPNDAPFWVKIEVQGTYYDFTKHFCDSGVSWSSGAGELPCPGTAGDSKGWVRVIDEPVLENGVVDDEPGLQVHPQMVHDGWIRGTYPEITITSGVSFKSIIGCYGSADCDVKFKLNYRVDGGPEQSLATWHEVQDGRFSRVSVDLNRLAGRKVQFILLVEANGSAVNDEALWFGPRIEP